MWTKYPEIQNELNAVEELLRKNIVSRNKLLTGVVGELVQSGGKRLRPVFVVLASRFGRCDRQKMLSLAGAVEVLHTATLVHDDIIDRASFRRGRMTVSEKYGADMAVYTGDFLFAKAVLMLSDTVPAEKVSMVARAVKTMCEGEVDQYQDRFNLDLSVLSYLKRINRKTALLFAASAASGAYIAGCEERIVNAFGRFGFYYGMAFQIKDDLNDFLSDARSSGKPVGNDILKGVVTLPVIYAVGANPQMKKAIEGFIGKDDSSGIKAEDITSLVQSSGGIEQSRRLMEKYVARGKTVLEALPDNQYRDIFADLINRLLD